MRIENRASFKATVRRNCKTDTFFRFPEVGQSESVARTSNGAETNDFVRICEPFETAMFSEQGKIECQDQFGRSCVNDSSCQVRIQILAYSIDISQNSLVTSRFLRLQRLAVYNFRTLNIQCKKS
jgi:hypothetical protein